MHRRGNGAPQKRYSLPFLAIAGFISVFVARSPRACFFIVETFWRIVSSTLGVYLHRLINRKGEATEWTAIVAEVVGYQKGMDHQRYDVKLGRSYYAR